MFAGDAKVALVSCDFKSSAHHDFAASFKICNLNFFSRVN